MNQELDNLIKRLKANDVTLTSINLFDNNIGTEGARALAKALQENKTVTSIDLGDNNIGDGVQKNIQAAIDDNKRIKAERLIPNPIFK